MAHRPLQVASIVFGIAILHPSTDVPAAGAEKRLSSKTGSVTTNDHYAPFLINNVFSGALP